MSEAVSKSGPWTLGGKDCFGADRRRTLGEELRLCSHGQMRVGVACHRGSSGHRTGGGRRGHGSNGHRSEGGLYRCLETVGGGWCYCSDDCRTFLGMSGRCHVLNRRMSSVARGSRGSADPLQATHSGHCPSGKKDQEMEAPSRQHPHPAVVCHWAACQKEGWIAGVGNGIWSDVGSDTVICDGEGTCGGVLTDVVNGADEERSGDGGVFPVIDRADVHVGCPECSRRSSPGASSPATGASGAADGCTNHPCCTSYYYY